MYGIVGIMEMHCQYTNRVPEILNWVQRYNIFVRYARERGKKLDFSYWGGNFCSQIEQITQIWLQRSRMIDGRMDDGDAG